MMKIVIEPEIDWEKVFPHGKFLEEAGKFVLKEVCHIVHHALGKPCPICED